MTVGYGIVGAVVVVDEVGAIQIGGLFALGYDVVVGTVEKVVGSQVHLVVEEGPRTVGAGHVRRGDAVSTAHESPAASAASAAAHIAHHAAGEVVEAAVIGIVGIEDYAQLPVFGEVADETGALVAPVVRDSLRSGDVVSDASHEIAECAVHHTLLDRKVDDGFFLAVVDAGELSLLALLVHHLDAVDYLGGDILGSELRVVQEESLAADGYLFDSLSVGSDGTVVVHLDAGKLLEEVFQYVVVGGLERRRIVFNRILLDYDGIADVGDLRAFQLLCVGLHLQGSEVKALAFHLEILPEVLISEQFRLHFISAVTYSFELYSAVRPAEDVFVHLGGAFAGKGNGCETYRLAGLGIRQDGGNCVLGGEA